MTFKRLKSISVSRTQLSTLPLLLVASLFAYFYWYPGYRTPPLPFNELKLSQQIHPEFLIESNFGLNQQNKFDGSFRLLVKSDYGSVNIKEVKVELKDNGDSVIEPVKLKQHLFSSTSLFKRKLMPEKLAKADKMITYLELNTGELITNHWSLSE